MEQILDLKNTLYYLGIPTKTKSFIFKDNRFAVDSSITQCTKIFKRYITLFFHHMRKAIAAKIIGYYFIPREINPTNILSKY